MKFFMARQTGLRRFCISRPVSHPALYVNIHLSHLELVQPAKEMSSDVERLSLINVNKLLDGCIEEALIKSRRKPVSAARC